MKHMTQCKTNGKSLVNTLNSNTVIVKCSKMLFVIIINI